MSENGPREGTRDLPRPGPDSGRRSVEPDSPAGVAYATLSRSLRRRRAELVDFLEAGRTPTEAARAYEADHPLEAAVSREELAIAAAEVERQSVRPPRSAPTRPVRDAR
jgi:hypothetical protein